MHPTNPPASINRTGRFSPTTPLSVPSEFFKKSFEKQQEEPENKDSIFDSFRVIPKTTIQAIEKLLEKSDKVLSTFEDTSVSVSMTADVFANTAITAQAAIELQSESLDSIYPKLISLLDKLTCTLDKIDSATGEAASKIGEIKDDAKNVLSSFATKTGISIACLLVIFLTVKYYSSSKARLPIIMATILTAFATFFPETIRESLSKLVSYLTRPETIAEPQASASVISSMATLLSSFFLLSFGLSQSSNISVIKLFKDFLPLKNGLANFIPDALKLVENLINAVRMNVFGCTSAINLFSSDDPEFDTLLAQCREEEFMLDSFKFKKNIASADRLRRLNVKLFEYVKKFSNDKSTINIQVKAMCMMLGTKFNKVLAEMAATGVDGVSIRPQPVAIVLLGGPQKFKSTLMDSFVAAVAGKTLDEREKKEFKECPGHFTYNMDIKSEYFENYNPSVRYVKIDEIGAVSSPTLETDSYSKLVLLINISPYTLNGAAVEKKNTLVFKPEFIVMSTNELEVRDSKQKDMGAYYRRVTEFLPIPLKRYMLDPNEADPWKFKVDSEKVEADGRKPWEVMRFCKVIRRSDNTFSHYSETLYSFEEVVHYVATKMATNKRHYEMNAASTFEVFDMFSGEEPIPFPLEDQSEYDYSEYSSEYSDEISESVYEYEEYANIKSYQSPQKPGRQDPKHKVAAKKQHKFKTNQGYWMGDDTPFLSSQVSPKQEYLFNLVMASVAKNDPLRDEFNELFNKNWTSHQVHKLLISDLEIAHPHLLATIESYIRLCREHFDAFKQAPSLSDRIFNFIRRRKHAYTNWYTHEPILGTILTLLPLIGIAYAMYNLVNNGSVIKNSESNEWADKYNLNMKDLPDADRKTLNVLTPAILEVVKERGNTKPDETIDYSDEEISTPEEYFQNLAEQLGEPKVGSLFYCYSFLTSRKKNKKILLDSVKMCFAVIDSHDKRHPTETWMNFKGFDDQTNPDKIFSNTNMKSSLKNFLLLLYSIQVLVNTDVLIDAISYQEKITKDDPIFKKQEASHQTQQEEYDIMTPLIDSQSYAPRKDHKVSASRKTVVTHPANKPVTLDATTQSSAKDLHLINFCKKNLLQYYIFDETTMEWTPIGYILMVGGRSGLMPAHYYDQIGNRANGSFKYLLKDCEGIEKASGFSLDCSYVRPDNGDDIMLVTLRGGNAYRNIVDWFFTKEEFYSSVMPVTLINFSKNFIKAATDNSAELYDQPVIYDNDWSTAYTAIYAITTQDGDCGSALITGVNSCRILGIHVAGNPKRNFGIGFVVTKERVIEMLKTSGDAFYFTNNNILDDKELSPQGHPIIRKLEKRILRSGNSKITESLLPQILGPSKKKQAVLKPTLVDGKYVDPLLLAIDKYGKPEPSQVDMEALNMAIEEMASDYIYTYCKRPGVCDILTVEEVMSGSEKFPAIGPMPRGTSPGYPYSEFDKDIKKRVIGTGDFNPNNLHFKKYKAKIHGFIDKMENGERCEFIYKDFLKDEVRPMHKVESLSTRLVSGANFDLTTLDVMYFGAFMSYIIENRLVNTNTVGVNPYGMEWTVMANMLEQYGFKNVACGDFKEWDIKLKQLLMTPVLDMINTWYYMRKPTEQTRRDNKVRIGLFYEIIFSKHVFMDIIVEWSSSMPSGGRGTTLFNSLSNELAVRYCFVKTTRHIPQAVFSQHMKLFTHGDDNIWGVHDMIKKHLTPKMMGYHMKSLGATYTSADKTRPLLDTFEGLDQCDFLKRRFVFDRSLARYIAPLDLDVILDMPLWTCTNEDRKIEVMGYRIEACLLELALHGKDIWHKYGPDIIKAYRIAYKRSPLRITYIKNRQFILSINEPLGACSHKSSFEDPQFLDHLDSWLPEIKYKADEKQLDPLLESLTELFIEATPQSALAAVLPKLSGNISAFDKIGDMSNKKPPAQNTNMGSDAVTPLDGTNYTSVRTDGTSQEDSTTSFLNTAEQTSTTVDNRMSLPYQLTASSSSGHMSSIVDFLKKPVSIGTGVLQGTDGPTTFPVVSFTQLLKTIPMYSDKLKGLFSIKADFKFILQVNANPFQAGLYKLCYVPLSGASDQQIKSIHWYRMHTATKVQMSQLQSAELDLNCDSSTELIVPYVSVYNAIPLSIDPVLCAGTLGYVFIYPYSPLVSIAGSTTVSYTLWMCLDNITLGAPAIPQSRSIKGKGKNNTLIEQQSVGIQPLSSGLKTISQGLGQLSQIPMLSSFTSTPAWALDVVSNSLKSYGFSKPLNLAPTGKMQRSVFPNHSLVDAVDNSVPISYTATNQVQTLPGFAGTNTDEMSFDFIKTIPAWYRTFTWSTTMNAGDQIAIIPIDPTVYFTTTVENATNIFHMTPITFLCQYFQQYRGGLVFRFKIVKTGFHAGRLQFAFNPREPMNNAPALTYSLTQYLHREVMDISGTSEITIEIPYVSVVPYRTTGSTSNIGDLLVSVVDPLVAPDTVSNIISIVVEVCGASDFELAMPGPLNLIPVVNATIQSPPLIVNSCSVKNGGISDSKEVGDNITTSTYCVGEKLLSFRQLLKIYNRRLVRNTYVQTPEFNTLPFEVNAAYSAPVFLYTVLKPDLYSMLGCIYSLSRGGVMVRNGRDSNINRSLMTATNIPEGQYNLQYSGEVLVPPPFVTSSLPTVFADSINEFCTSAFCPSYGCTHSRSNVDNLVLNETIPNTQKSLFKSAPKYSLRTSTGGTELPTHFRAGGEDLDFGLFVSIPPVVGIIAYPIYS